MVVWYRNRDCLKFVSVIKHRARVTCRFSWQKFRQAPFLVGPVQTFTIRRLYIKYTTLTNVHSFLLQSLRSHFHLGFFPSRTVYLLSRILKIASAIATIVTSSCLRATIIHPTYPHNYFLPPFTYWKWLHSVILYIECLLGIVLDEQ